MRYRDFKAKKLVLWEAEDTSTIACRDVGFLVHVFRDWSAIAVPWGRTLQMPRLYFGGVWQYIVDDYPVMFSDVYVTAEWRQMDDEIR